MRKVLYLLTILVAFGQVASAQTYYPVTHLTGNAVVNGTTVGVSTVGSPTSTGNFCGPNTSPYYIGITNTSGYSFSFNNANNPVTHLRMYFSELHDQDSIEFTINGSKYTLQPSDMSTFAGTCGLSNTQTIISGALSATNNQGLGRGGVQLDIQVSPNTISSLSVVNHSVGTGANGAVFALLIANDSCTQRFEATADSPYCRTRNLNLYAPGFPNTTYSWSTNVSGWTSNQQNPVFGPLSVGAASFYVVATRGACVFRDTVSIFVDNIPVVVGNTQVGPLCPGNNDTITTTASGLAGGGTYNWIHPQTGVLTTSFNNEQPINNISTADSGTWKVFASSLNGCLSDTVDFRLLVNPDVQAAFKVDSGAGCFNDTAFITNLSSGNTINNWTFGDGNSSTVSDPVHIYQNQGTYTITLIASNSACADTTDKTITISHPLIAAFNITDDSICQGTKVAFSSLPSVITPGTGNQTSWLWEYGTGDTSQRVNADTFQYNNQGEYLVKLIITDYLGCSDTADTVIVVDSAGFISYASSTDSICAGEAIQFSGTYNLQGNTGVKWTFGDGVIIDDSSSIRHVFEQSGVYNVVFDATYRICPSVTQSTPMFVGAYPIVDLGDDTALCLNGEPVFIEDRVNKGNGKAKFSWNTPTTVITPGTYVRHPGVYALTVEIDGCSTTDSVEVKKNCYINIPNVFTPNNDGYNDYFLPRQLLSRNVTDFKMKIFNRWGEIVFETTSLNGRGWDGKVNDEYQPTGVYIYLIEVTFGNNTNERYQGNVTLIR